MSSEKKSNKKREEQTNNNALDELEFTGAKRGRVIGKPALSDAIVKQIEHALEAFEKKGAEAVALPMLEFLKKADLPDYSRPSNTSGKINKFFKKRGIQIKCGYEQSGGQIKFWRHKWE